MDNWGFLGLVVILLALVAAIAIPNLTTVGHHHDPETGAIGTMRALFSAEEQFRILKRKGDQYGTLAELSANGIFSGIPPSGLKVGYLYNLTLSKDRKAFIATASPETEDGGRMFSVFNSGTLTYSTTGYATMTDPPID